MTIYPVPKPVRGVVEKDRPRKGLKNRIRMKKVNRKRGGHAFPKNVDLKYRAFIRGEPCILAGLRRPIWRGITVESFSALHQCNSRTRCCHLKSRGAGGPDMGNTWPGCDAAHDEQHRLGIPSFQQRWGVRLEHIAAGLALRYQETGGM